jgi:transcriptional/translational regulatory protein YebC/TACO1
MSGHSKWATTKHKKAVVDARRGKLFAKLIKNVEVAARTGGADPAGNPTLYDAVQKAKKNSVPNENIDRAIRRGAGLEAGGAQYETVTYEGYAPGGVAVLVECLTDNRNRAAADTDRAHPHGGPWPTRLYLVPVAPQSVVLVSKADGVTRTTCSPPSDAGGEINDLGQSFEVISEPTDLVTVRTAVTDRAGVRVRRGRVPAHGGGRTGRGARQAGVPGDRDARGLRRRPGRVRELLGLRRGDGEARLRRCAGASAACTTSSATPRPKGGAARLGRDTPGDLAAVRAVAR